jgi:transposase
LGNPTGIHLTAGQVHDLVGSDELLPALEANFVLADKAYDADERVIEPLRAAGKQAVIPSKKNRKEPRPYDRELCKTRSLVETFFCNLKQFRAIATRCDKTARNFLAAVFLASAAIWLN